MDFLQDKGSRRFFLFLSLFSFALLLSIFCLSWFHAEETRRLLLEKEQLIASSLLDEGISPLSVARAFQNTSSSPSGEKLLLETGRTASASFRLFPSINRSFFLFLAVSSASFGLAASLLMFCAIRFFRKKEALYQTAADAVLRFSEGRFDVHLPQNESGTLFLLFASVENLATALKAQSEQELKRREFLKNMISDISHQLKTPLAALSMYMEIIQDEPDQPETVQHFSGKAFQSLKRMEQLIQSLLKVARLDTGSIVFRKRTVPISRLLELAAKDLSERAKREEKKLVFCGDTSDTVFCDPEWTGEAIENLVKNALDHTESGGTIKIRWQSSPGAFRLSVTDDGHGIDPEDIYHIFKRFYRSPHQKSSGVGLGLPLAKAIVEGQGGTILAESPPGQGASFTVTFLTEL